MRENISNNCVVTGLCEAVRGRENCTCGKTEDRILCITALCDYLVPRKTKSTAVVKVDDLRSLKVKPQVIRSRSKTPF